jgi:hypothetical protein
VPHLVEQAAGDLAGECSLAVRDAVEERCDLLRRLALQQVAGGAGADRREKVLLGAGGGEHDDLTLRSRMPQARQSGQPVHARHREVEQDEIGLQALGVLDCRLSLRGDADHVEAVRAKQRREGVAGQRMVVDDQDAGGHSLPYRHEACCR